MPIRASALARYAALALPLLTLAGCAGDGEQYAPPCPKLALLPEASDVATYAGTGRDLTDLVFQARIVGVPARCARGDPGIVAATLRVGFDLTRGPADKSREIDLPYFVGVAEGSHILDEHDYVLHAIFPPNVDERRADSDEISLNLPVSKDKNASAYSIYVGFRLSPEQLQQNRAHPAR